MTVRVEDWLPTVTTVLFDLDGTLHDDPRATDHYAAALERALPQGGGLVEEVEAVAAREHPAVAPGSFVDPQRGLVVHTSAWSAVVATDWQGRPAPLPPDLRGPVRHRGPLRYLGDRWQVVGALAARRGASAAQLREAFVAARELINDRATELVRMPCLDQVLDRLGEGRRLLLATNTPEVLGRPLVERLAMSRPFEVTRYDADKPAGCLELLEVAERSWGAAPHQVLVVGDNLWNDLLPPAGRGSRTVHLDPLDTDPDALWSTARYPDLASFAADLEVPARAR